MPYSLYGIFRGEDEIHTTRVFAGAKHTAKGLILKGEDWHIEETQPSEPIVIRHDFDRASQEWSCRHYTR